MSPTESAARVDSGNSTNVRSWADRAAPWPIRAVFRAIGPFPELAGAVAGRLFMTPPRPRVSPRFTEILSVAEPLEIPWQGRALQAWSWGTGPAVLLVHGWGGYGAQLASFVPALESGGYRAIVLDGPAHGKSPGRRTSLVEFADAVLRTAEETGPLAGIVAHSFGGASTAIAIARGLRAGRIVFVGPASDPVLATRRFTAALGLPESGRRAMQSRLERKVGVRFDDLNVPRLAAGFDVPLRVVHDRADREVPWEEGSAIAAAWPGAELITTRGLGHYRILHDPEVIRGAVEFLKTGSRLREDAPQQEQQTEAGDRQGQGHHPAVPPGLRPHGPTLQAQLRGLPGTAQQSFSKG
jgi:pimeloyl-ACP methyl ester carboxylesterase